MVLCLLIQVHILNFSQCFCSKLNLSVHYVSMSQDPLMAQMVKNLPAMCETWVQSLGQEDPLEKRMATHCSIFFFF